MRKLTVTIAICLVMLSTGITAGAAGNFDKISESVYAYTDVKNASPANSFAANAGIIIGEKGIVVVDALASAKEAARMLADIKKITDKPIDYVINTHFHFDHVLGNSVFEKQGAVIVSHENCREEIMKNGDGVLSYIKNMGMTDEMLEGTEVAYPKVTFKQKMQIDLGNLVVELMFFGHGHAPGNIMVYVPKEKALFAGDLLFTDFHPYMGTADVDGWIKNLDAIAGMDLEKIIPGHGPLSGKKDVLDQKTYLLAFDEAARKLCATSQNIDEIVEKLKASVPPKAQGEWMIKSNIEGKYLKKAE